MMTKICTKCKKDLPATIEYFSLDKRNRSGLQSRCKACGRLYYHQHREQSRQYYQRNREKYLQQMRQRRQQHLDTASQYHRQYRNTLGGYLREVYSHMKSRCNNPSNKSYKDYGGRGIQCRFKNPNDFIDHVVKKLGLVSMKLIRGLQVDRIDNNGHYERGNIRFVTRSENVRNSRRYVI